MRVLDLFSGIGGFSLGLERAGFTTVAFCEIDPYARAVLRKHWPDVPCYDDVRTVTAARLAADGIIAGTSTEAMADPGLRRCGGTQTREMELAWRTETISTGIDVICGGFPCQDISHAGKGAGLAGERSGLWSEIARLVGELRPRYVIVENVAALLGRGLDVVLGDLAEIGYDAEWHCIPASYVGAPHRRDRIWIVAYPNRERGSATIQSRTNVVNDVRESSQLRDWQGKAEPEVADTDQPRLEGWLLESLRECASERTAGARGASVGNASRNMLDGAGEAGSRWRGQSTDAGWWSSEPRMGGTFDGFPSWLDRHCGRGMSYAESLRGIETLRLLWTADVAQEVWHHLGGLGRVQQAEVLFDLLRPLEKDRGPAGEPVASAEVRETFLRSLRGTSFAPCPSCEPELVGQSTGEPANPLQVVPQLPARDCEAPWPVYGWEDGIPRIANGVRKRVDRLRCLGNAVVPQIPEILGRAIMAAEGLAAP